MAGAEPGLSAFLKVREKYLLYPVPEGPTP
jgi:hypothetical protein